MNATLLTAATLIALIAPAMAGDPDPEVVAALLKKFPAMRQMTPEQRDIDIGVGTDGVVFYTPDWHMYCNFTRNLVRLKNCRIVHG